MSKNHVGGGVNFPTLRRAGANVFGDGARSASLFDRQTPTARTAFRWKQEKGAADAQRILGQVLQNGGAGFGGSGSQVAVAMVIDAQALLL